MDPFSDDFQKLLSTPDPPHLGPEHRASTLSIREIDRELTQLLDKASDGSQLIRATLYLWHDHLDEAHSLAQEIETSDGSYLHGIMHRREPDYSNARYWFNRVGKHPCFAPLAKRSREILASGSVPELTGAANKSEWDPYAFIDACQRVAKTQNTREIQILRQIQAAELEILLRHFSAEAP